MTDELAQVKERARKLLDELPLIKGLDVAGLVDWNIRTQTLLVFEAGRQHCVSANDKHGRGDD